MAAAEALIALRDATGSGMITGTSAESEPPWNAPAAYALLIPHHEVRALEWEVRRQVSGSDLCRGGSAANTQGAIRALVRMSAGLPEDQAAHIAAQMDRWSALAFALPAVERLPQWLDGFMGEGRPDPDCPYCGHGTLRANDAVGIVACLKPSCPAIINGSRPWARIDRDRAGAVVLRWLDGTTQTNERTLRPGGNDARPGRDVATANGVRRAAAPDHPRVAGAQPDRQDRALARGRAADRRL
jgi:hypothetical protein